MHKLALLLSLFLLPCGARQALAVEPGSAPRSPVPPRETLGLFQLHPDCRIELAAAEPDVIDPVHIAFDPDGRMWVVEYSDYPNGPADGEPGRSRIRVLTDDDGDGRFTDARVFADKLLFANGLTFWKDGVIVTTDGAVVFLRDTDGDGRADDRQVWFTGFQRENPQLRANHPTFTLDNHFHIANGLRGGDVVAGPDWAKAFPRRSTGDPQPVSLSGRDFRFDPITGHYEAVSGMGQFGVSFDDWGNRFICSNRNPCDHVVLEDWYLQRNPAVAVPRVVEVVSPAAEQSRIFPISRFWTTSNLHAGQFTAACGICLYRGDALPASFYGNSFICDPTGNLVHRDILKPNGATFTSTYDREGIEFLATTDEWCRPVNLTIGPDGALYVVDMYRAVIEHPQFMPDELKDRPDLWLGTDRGRIYRIVSKEAPPGLMRPWPKLVGASSDELVDLLSHPNAWQRETAHRLLFERQDAAIAAQLKLLASTGDSAPARAHALWLLRAFDRLDDSTIVAGLNDAHPGVAIQAARLAESRSPHLPELAKTIEAVAAATNDGRLRFQCILSLSAFPWSPQRGKLVAQLVVQHPEDEWLQTAVAATVQNPEAIVLAALHGLAHRGSARPPDVIPRDDLPYVPLLRRFGELAARQQEPSTLGTLLEALPQLPLEARYLCVSAVCSGLRQRGLTWDQASQKLDPETVAEIADVFDWAMRRARSPVTTPESEAVRVLEYAPWTNAAVLLDVSKSHEQQSVRTQAVQVLGRRPDSEIGPALLDNFSAQTPAFRAAILSSMYGSTQRVLLLLDEIAAGRISPREIDPTRAGQLRNHRDSGIRERAQALLKDDADADRAKVLADYQPAFAARSDPQRGREVFAKNCAQCHKVGDLGVNVAPDISDSRVKTAEQLLVSILDPNRAIDNNYFSFTVIDKGGLVHTGVIASETATSVTLRQPEGKEVTLLRSDIDELKSNGISLMPVGLEKDVSVEQMADLISFIKNWRYLDGSVPPEVIR